MSACAAGLAVHGWRPAEAVAVHVEDDPMSGQMAEVRRIQPYAATKHYRCPGCNQEIMPGVGHLAIVPLSEPDARRHWHHACWANRRVRRPGRPMP